MGRFLARLSAVLLLAASSMVAALTTAAVHSAAATSCSRCVTAEVRPPRNVHVSDDRVEVILPSGYRSSPKRHYPVIYLFNGLSGPYNEWVKKSDIVAYSAQYQAIFVDMAAGDNANAGYFTNWWDGTYQWETWHTRTVMPWVDSHFRTIPHDSAAVGLSLGAFGALGYQERHRGMFRAVASFSGFVDSEMGSPAGAYLEAENNPRFKRMWGDPTASNNGWAAHNPTDSVAKLRGTPLFLASGTGTPSTDTSIHGGDTEMAIFAGHARFLAALSAAGVAHTDHFYPGGAHNWSAFQGDLHWALPQIMKHL